MPSGRTHDRITLWCVPWILGLSYLITGNGTLTLIVVSAFGFSGLMFGPDLDIYSRQFQRWGVLRFIWLPYQKCLRHRSLFSHGILIGTILRLLYLLILLGVVAIPVVGVAQLFFGFDWNWQVFYKTLFKSLKTQYPYHAIALFIGLELGSMSHSLSDWIGSAYKRRQKVEGGRQKAEGKRQKAKSTPSGKATRKRNKG